MVNDYDGWETFGLTRECRECGAETGGFDEDGPLCIDCAIVKACTEGDETLPVEDLPGGSRC